MALADLTLSNANAGRLERTFQEAIEEIKTCWRPENRRRGPAKINIVLVLTPNQNDSAFKVSSQLSVLLPPRKDESTGFQQGASFKVDDGSSNVMQISLFNSKDFETPVREPAFQVNEETGEITEEDDDDGI